MQAYVVLLIAVLFWASAGDRIPLWLIGVLGCGAMQWLFFLSAQRTYASHLTLIMALVPLTSRLYGVWFRRERLSARASVGLALGLAGSILILWPSASVGRSIWFLFLQPVIGAGLAQAALGESITSRLAAGTLIVIAGLYLIHSSKGKSGLSMA